MLSLSCRSVAFVKTFCSEASPREKIDALRKACKAHTDLTRQCSKGLGQDRILYAMYCLAQQAREKRQRALSNGDASSSSSETESSDEADEVSVKIAERIPELFKDPGYAQLGHSTLSTSNCGNVSLRLFGFGPVVGDGLGIGYIIKVRARSLPLPPLSPSSPSSLSPLLLPLSSPSFFLCAPAAS